jgi:hypothetical protein
MLRATAETSALSPRALSKTQASEGGICCGASGKAHAVSGGGGDAVGMGSVAALLVYPPEPRRFLRHERLAPGHLRRLAGERLGYGPAAVDALPSAAGRQRVPERHADLCAHDDAAAMARLAQRPPARPLAQGRPPLSARSHAGRAQNPEYRVADDVRIATERRSISRPG